MFEMFRSRVAWAGALAAMCILFVSSAVPFASQPPQEAPAAQTSAPRHAGGEANLVLPDLGVVEFNGINGRTLLKAGLLVCVAGLAFGW